MQITNNNYPWPHNWGHKTSLMGIINLTPDSFSDGGDLNSIYEAIIIFYDNDNYKQLGKNAFTFSKNFNWDKIIKKYIKLI